MRSRTGTWARTARRVVFGAAAVTAAGFALLLSPQPARAQVDQSPGAGCSATINGSSTDAPFTSDNAIQVREHTGVSVSMHLSSPVHHRVIAVGFGIGPAVTVSDETDPSSETTSVSVDKYATYGVGLYAVSAIADSTGGQHCEVHQMVSVAGNPLTTVAGGVAGGLTLLSLGGLAVAAVSGANPGDAFDDTMATPTGQSAFPPDERMPGDVAELTNTLSVVGFCVMATLPALLLTSAAMVGGAAPGGPTPRRLARVHWRPRLSVVGILSGLVGAVAVVVLLQQSGRLFPSYEILGRALVAGLLAGILVPSLTRLIAVRRANRRIAMREAAASALNR